MPAREQPEAALVLDSLADRNVVVFLPVKLQPQTTNSNLKATPAQPELVEGRPLP